MSSPVGNGGQREFRCKHCNGKILVPSNLPATTGPCPHCQGEITSPGPELPSELDPIFGRPILTDSSPAGSATVAPPPLPPQAEMDRIREESEKKIAAEKAAQEEEVRKEAEAKAVAEAKAEEERKAAEVKAAAEAEEQRKKIEKTAAAEAKAEMERLAAESKAEMERQAAEAKAEMERNAAEARAEIESKEQAKAAEEQALAAAAVAAQAKAMAEKAEQERLAAAKADEEKARLAKAAEHEARQRAEQEKLAAAEAAKLAQKELQASPLASMPPVAVAETSSKTPETKTEIKDPFAEGPAEDGKAAKSGKATKEKAKRSKTPLVVAMALILVAAAAYFIVPGLLEKSEEALVVDTSGAAAKKEAEYLKTGWEVDARQVLAEFLEASTASGKASQSIRGAGLLAEMEDYYDGNKIDDSDTPESAFSVYPLTMKDKERGIFMLTYDQPPAYELSEFFTPLAPLDVKFQLREPDMLLASVGRSNNFTTESLRVHALFKRSEDGMKLDWETFVQTKDRTLRDFLELPVPGRKEIFRVIVSETVPEKRNAPAGHRTYLIADPAHRSDDSARVNVPGDSDIGRAFSILNWRGTKEGRVVAKTATIELAWSDEATPQLSVSRFICWEFLGVGGEAVAP